MLRFIANTTWRSCTKFEQHCGKAKGTKFAGSYTYHLLLVLSTTAAVAFFSLTIDFSNVRKSHGHQTEVAPAHLIKTFEVYWNELEF